ncbi:hypothetical protein [uncultured Shimia sp.]|uniref:tetratricopeptide repeat protein n=1 Tax=uncultured Shimia sp. TaxID=573152 RepID=UPI0026188354|nr:hypothetical protein [uncultured Shimia sp.]
MPYPILHAARLVLFFAIATPALAETLEPQLQEQREYYSALSKRACQEDRGAIEELRSKAMMENHPVAMNSMAWLILTKKCNYKDYPQSAAVDLQYGSAQAGYPIALLNYAKRLTKGLLVVQDHDYAHDYFYRAMRQQYGGAAIALGLEYVSGTHMPKNPTRAREMLHLALELGADGKDIERLRDQLEQASIPTSRPHPNQHPWSFTQYSTHFSGMRMAYWEYFDRGLPLGRVFVGVDPLFNRLLLGMSVVSADPIVRFFDVHVDPGNGDLVQIPVMSCQQDSCITSDKDAAGSQIQRIVLTLPRDSRESSLEAIKAGAAIVFRFQTRATTSNAQARTFAFSLFGSHEAMEMLAENSQ